MARPRRTEDDRLREQDHYLLARYELTDLLTRLPTVVEIADHMKISPRKVEMIRADMRQWQRDTAAALGWKDWSADGLHPLDGFMSPRAKIRLKYVMGEIGTAEAVLELELDGLPSDPRELRRWRSAQQQNG